MKSSSVMVSVSRYCCLGVLALDLRDRIIFCVPVPAKLAIFAALAFQGFRIFVKSFIYFAHGFLFGVYLFVVYRTQPSHKQWITIIIVVCVNIILAAHFTRRP